MTRLSLIVLLALTAPGCDMARECGEGTTLVDGVCLVPEQTLQERCGAMAEFDLTTGQCRPIRAGSECGEGTLPVPIDEAVVECQCIAESGQ